LPINKSNHKGKDKTTNYERFEDENVMKANQIIKQQDEN
jgi:hypothetical protein